MSTSASRRLSLLLENGPQDSQGAGVMVVQGEKSHISPLIDAQPREEPGTIGIKSRRLFLVGIAESTKVLDRSRRREVLKINEGVGSY